MEVTKQGLDQVMLTQLAQPARRGARTEQEKGTGFDDLLQQKRQEPEETADSAQAGQDKPDVQDKEPTQEAAETPEQPKAEAGQEEIPEDTRALLAAMMLQPQQIQTDAVQAAPETAGTAETVVVAEVQADLTQASPEVVQAGQTVQQAAPVEQPATAEVQAPTRGQETGQTLEAVPRQDGQTVQAPAEAVQAPAEEGQARQAAQTAGREAQAPAESVRPQEDGEMEEIPEEMAEAPLFSQEVESAPVKVGEPVLNPREPVHIEGNEAPREMADVLIRGFDQNNEVSVIQIEPGNLGPVRLTLSRDAGGLTHMVLEAVNPRTQTLLEKHMDNIQRILDGSMREDVRVEIKREPDQMFPENWKENQGQQQQRQQDQRRQEQSGEPAQDFMHRLRLGLTGDADAS